MRVNQRNLRLVQPAPKVQQSLGSNFRYLLVGIGWAYVGLNVANIIVFLSSDEFGLTPFWRTVCFLPALAGAFLAFEILGLLYTCCNFESLAILVTMSGPPIAIVMFSLKRTWVWAVLIVVLTAIWFFTAIEFVTRQIASV
jgi:hypothetical protein